MKWLAECSAKALGEALRVVVPELSEYPVTVPGPAGKQDPRWHSGSVPVGERCFVKFSGRVLLRAFPGPGMGPGLELLTAVMRHYQQVTGRQLSADRVMAWHLRQALYDALWTSEAGITLNDHRRPPQWVEDLAARFSAFGRVSAGGGTGHQFSGSHGDGRDHRDRWPRANALGQRVGAAHRGHVHGAQPGCGSRPASPVPVPCAPGAGCGEQHTAQVTATGLPCGKESSDQAGGSDGR